MQTIGIVRCFGDIKLYVAYSDQKHGRTMDALPPTALHRIFVLLAGSPGLDVQRSVPAARLGQASAGLLEHFAIIGGLAEVDPVVFNSSTPRYSKAS